MDYILTMYAELAQDELAQVGQTAQEWLVWKRGERVQYKSKIYIEYKYIKNYSFLPYDFDVVTFCVPQQF